MDPTKDNEIIDLTIDDEDDPTPPVPTTASLTEDSTLDATLACSRPSSPASVQGPWIPSIGCQGWAPVTPTDINDLGSTSEWYAHPFQPFEYPEPPDVVFPFGTDDEPSGADDTSVTRHPSSPPPSPSSYASSSRSHSSCSHSPSPSPSPSLSLSHSALRSPSIGPSSPDRAWEDIYQLTLPPLPAADNDRPEASAIRQLESSSSPANLSFVSSTTILSPTRPYSSRSSGTLKSTASTSNRKTGERRTRPQKGRTYPESRRCVECSRKRQTCDYQRPCTNCTTSRKKDLFCRYRGEEIGTRANPNPFKWVYVNPGEQVNDTVGDISSQPLTMD